MTMTTPDPQRSFTAPSPPPGYGPPYARPPKRKMSQGAIALITVGAFFAVLILVVGALALGGSAGTSGSDREVRIVSCGDGGRVVGAQAEVEVTNKSARTHTYEVRVSFTDGGSVVYASGTALIRDIGPGQAGRGTVTSWRSDDNITKCEIARVDQSVF